MDILVSGIEPKSDTAPVRIAGRSGGLLVAGITGGVAVALSVVCYPFVSPALRRICLPYVPATTQQVANVLHVLRGNSGRLLDIGSGDGRIVVAAAKNGFKSDGVELNYWLVLYSRISALRSGVSRNASFHRKDLWTFDLKPYDNIVIFGVKEMMADLNEKFDKELSNTHVVACRFPLPNRQPIKVHGTGIDTVWLYHFKK
uniref:Protein FAM173B n=2 Tax=Lygus hesperus TaxID=30085 RepID=A0A0A9W502_LYGHE